MKFVKGSNSMLLMGKKKVGRPKTKEAKQPIQAMARESLCTELDAWRDSVEDRTGFRPSRASVLIKALEEYLDRQRKAGDRGPRE